MLVLICDVEGTGEGRRRNIVLVIVSDVEGIGEGEEGIGEGKGRDWRRGRDWGRKGKGLG